MKRAPSLRRELLFNFSLLAVAALWLAVAAALVAEIVAPRYAVFTLVALILTDTVAVFLFGRYLLRRYVMRPLAEFTAGAQELTSGNVGYRVPEAETKEFTELAQQFNTMTNRLLEVQVQLVRAEKLASIGRLAAGIAHEVGNPLSAIRTYLDVLRRRGADAEIVEAVTHETARIDRIVSGLLAYARPREEGPTLVDLGAVLRSGVELLTQQGALRDTGVTVEIDDRAPKVAGRFHSLEQVAVNLLLNAVDAAPGGVIKAGVLTWELRRDDPARFRRDDPQRHPRAGDSAWPRPWRPEFTSPTPGALLYVADSGPGVPLADRERVFDPFFSTKAPGAGTGLGLAIVQRTVYELGGTVWVDEAREGGAAFKVFLPAENARG